MEVWNCRHISLSMEILLFTAASRTALRPTQPPIRWVPGALSLRVKLPTTYLHLVPRSTNGWSYTSTPQYAFTAWGSVKAQGHLHLHVLYFSQYTPSSPRTCILISVHFHKMPFKHNYFIPVIFKIHNLEARKRASFTGNHVTAEPDQKKKKRRIPWESARKRCRSGMWCRTRTVSGCSTAQHSPVETLISHTFTHASLPVTQSWLERILNVLTPISHITWRSHVPTFIRFS
jgi:hypothetical protein